MSADRVSRFSPPRSAALLFSGLLRHFRRSWPLVGALGWPDECWRVASDTADCGLQIGPSNSQLIGGNLAKFGAAKFARENFWPLSSKLAQTQSSKLVPDKRKQTTGPKTMDLLWWSWTKVRKKWTRAKRRREIRERPPCALMDRLKLVHTLCPAASLT